MTNIPGSFCIEYYNDLVHDIENQYQDFFYIYW